MLFWLLSPEFHIWSNIPKLGKCRSSSQRAAGPLTGRRLLSQGGQPSHRETGLTQRSWASHREAQHSTGTTHRGTALSTLCPCLWQSGWTSHKRDGPLKGRLGLSSGDWSSHREAVPLLNSRKHIFKISNSLSKHINKVWNVHKVRHFCIQGKTV